jgi:hypothetical protein
MYGVGAVRTFDAPSLEYDHLKGTWSAANEGIHNLLIGTKHHQGAMGAALTVCPPCSYYAEGHCNWCPGPEDPEFPLDYPECEHCKGKEPAKRPWYAREEIMLPLLTTILVTTIATVSSNIILKRVGYK